MTTPEVPDQFRIEPDRYFAGRFNIEVLEPDRPVWEDISMWAFTADDLAALRDAIDTVLNDGSGKRVGG